MKNPQGRGNRFPHSLRLVEITGKALGGMAEGHQ